MRRRKRSGGTWMPVLGTIFGDAGVRLVPLFGETGKVDINRDTAQIETRAIVPDQTLLQDTASTGTSLRDLTEGQDWLLQRIVGKINLDVVSATPSTTDADDVWPQVFVTAGIFVARATDDGQAIPDLEIDEMTPDLASNIQEPWLWRNTWLLDTPNNDGAENLNYGQYTNRYNGTVWESPRIDTKIKRRIKREHRLWLIVSARGWSPLAKVAVTGLDSDQPRVSYTADLRVYGGMRRATSKGSSF